MSRWIDLFIDAPVSLDQLAAHLAQLTGQTFAADSGAATRALRSGEVVAELGEHDFIDDRELRFSRYRYVVSTTVPSGRPVNDSPQAVLLREILSALRADGRFPTVLVFDLQHIVDRSEPPSVSSLPSAALAGSAEEPEEAAR